MESTREIPDTAASPTLVTMTVSAMPIVTANSTADGVSEIDETAHIERGYENIVEKLQALGADIRRVEAPVRMTRAM